MSDVIIQVKF